jgi:hypothetical protein
MEPHWRYSDTRRAEDHQLATVQVHGLRKLDANLSDGGTDKATGDRLFPRSSTVSLAPIDGATVLSGRASVSKPGPGSTTDVFRLLSPGER